MDNVKKIRIEDVEKGEERDIPVFETFDEVYAFVKSRYPETDRQKLLMQFAEIGIHFEEGKVRILKKTDIN